MANVSHATLTGADLHEPKGIATATSGQVYVADGAASGAWTTFADPFSGKLLHVRDSQSSGSAGASLTSSTWNTRILQTEVTDELSTGLSSNQITGLTAGTYWIHAWACFYTETATTATNDGNQGVASSSGTQRLRLQNITGGTTLVLGLNLPPTSRTIVMDPGASNMNVLTNAFSHGDILELSGRFTLASTSTVELQHYFGSANSCTCKSGSPASITSTNEVYADVMIWKLT